MSSGQDKEKCSAWFRRLRAPLSCDIDYELPKAVSSVRDGWQWTSQSGAVVSGLLAAVAAQLLSFFKSSDNFKRHHASQGVQDFIVAACYAALFLNIGATITSFILIDNLGEIGYQASCKQGQSDADKITDSLTVHQDGHLVIYGASPVWKLMLFYWLFTFYSGILALIISTLTYVIVEEPLATRISMTIIVGLIFFPSTYLIFIRPLFERPANTMKTGEDKGTVSINAEARSVLEDNSAV